MAMCVLRKIWNKPTGHQPDTEIEAALQIIVRSVKFETRIKGDENKDNEGRRQGTADADP